MDVTSPASAAQSSGTAPTAARDAADLAESFDNFLVLLTTQLQHQDPLDPLDTNEFTDQLVQFTSVEQAIKTNDKLDALIALQGADQLTGALGYIGKLVELEGVGLSLESGEATLVYDLSANAAGTSIEIQDQEGNTVRTLTGASGAGRHELVWDGKDDAGNQLPDGVYQFAVTAVDSSGQHIALSQGSFARVDGIEVVDGIVTLAVGDLKVTLSQIKSVRTDDDGTASPA